VAQVLLCDFLLVWSGYNFLASMQGWMLQLLRVRIPRISERETIYNSHALQEAMVHCPINGIKMVSYDFLLIAVLASHYY